MRELKKYIGRSRFYLFLKKNIIHLFYIFPIKKNKIVFDNFGGRGYGDDPRYIADELLKRNKNLKLIWVTSDLENKFPEGITKVKYGTICAAYHWITAAVWVDNIKSTIRPRKRNGQYYIQTWHSTLGFKKNEADAGNLPEKYIIEAQNDGKQIDLMYSNNDFRLDKYKNRYWYSGTVMKCDVPRMQILLGTPDDVRMRVCDCLRIHTDKLIVLYAPTFRKDRNLSLYKFDYRSCKEVFCRKFNKEVELLIRLHPNEADYQKELSVSQEVVNATAYPDMQELLAAADVLITDYSGCMFDFGLTGKPVFLLARDLENYLAKEREVYFSLSEVPFSLSQTEEELREQIQLFDSEKYARACSRFQELIGFSDSGHGAEQIADIILQKIERENREDVK